MIASLIKELFFLPEFINDLKLPVRRKYFINYLRRFTRSLFWLIYYDYPSLKLKLIGITGTDGKTTTANLLFHILKSANKKVSVISTIYGQIGNQVFDTGFHVTTPNVKDLQEYFKKAVGDGGEYFIIEATSHGLDQYRLLGCNFEIGVLTNLTHEHLDYHLTFDNYLVSKAKLFQRSKVSILNKDDKSFDKIKSYAKGKIVTYGLGRGFDYKLNISGEYNKYNALAAIAAAKQLGIDDKIVRKAVFEFKNLSGRMEEVKNNRGIKIIVDFAHTPNGIKVALQTLKGQSKGKLIAVFGSAGKRDVDKRSLMGQEVLKIVDLAVVTAEDSRGELEQINQQIVVGAKKSGGIIDKNLFVIEDRQQAIDFAIKSAKKGDVVGIFGKGHETSMNLDGKNELPWSDVKAVRKALR